MTVNSVEKELKDGRVIKLSSGNAVTGDGYRGSVVEQSETVDGVSTFYNLKLKLQNSTTNGTLEISSSDPNAEPTLTCLKEPDYSQPVVTFTHQSLDLRLPGGSTPHAGYFYLAALRVFGDSAGIVIKWLADDPEVGRTNPEISSGEIPDIWVSFSPAQMVSLEEDGRLRPLASQVVQTAEANYPAGVLEIGEIDGVLHSLPIVTSPKSIVWYSPAQFQAGDGSGPYDVPTTLGELKAIEDRMVANNQVPYCMGVDVFGLPPHQSAAYGFPMTDWIEDLILHALEPEDYDDWVAGNLKFSSASVKAQFERLSEILNERSYVFYDQDGDRLASWWDAFWLFGIDEFDIFPPFGAYALQLEEAEVVTGKCLMMRVENNPTFLPGKTVGADGDLYYFLFPGKLASDKRAVIGGSVVGVLAEVGDTLSNEAMDILGYVATADFFNSFHCIFGGGDKQAPNGPCLGTVTPIAGSLITTISGLDLSLVNDQVLEKINLISDPNTVLRFDGSDLMPSVIGQRVAEGGKFCPGAFWFEGVIGLIADDINPTLAIHNTGDTLFATDKYDLFADVLPPKSLDDALLAIDTAYENYRNNGTVPVCNIDPNTQKAFPAP